MPTCIGCGHEGLGEDVRFCPNCGARVTAKAALPPAPEILTPALPTGKSAGFSETLWFREGATRDPSEAIVDSDFELEREKLEDRYERKAEIDAAERKKFTLNE